MALKFKLPKLGENIDSGDVVKVLVRVGDQISQEQPLLELETEKAVIEVPCSIQGIVEEVHVSEGDSIKPGQLIVTVKESHGKATGKETNKTELSQGEKTNKSSPSKEKQSPKVKKLIRLIRIEEARQMADHVLNLSSVEEISRFIANEMRTRFPEDFNRDLSFQENLKPA